MTPEMAHTGRAPLVLAQREKVLDAAYAAHPERFVRRAPKPLALPEAVWINPPVESDARGCPRIDDRDPTPGSGTPLEATRCSAPQNRRSER